MREQIQASMMRETHPGFYDEGINPGLSNEGHTSFESNAQEKKRNTTSSVLKSCIN